MPLQFLGRSIRQSRERKEGTLFVSASTTGSREQIGLICHEEGHVNKDTQLATLTLTMSHGMYFCFLRKWYSLYYPTDLHMSF